MFNIFNTEEDIIEREEDYDNTESSTYLAAVYAQLSLSNSANGYANALASGIEF